MTNSGASDGVTVDVSVVVISWRMRDMLHALLSSICKQTRDLTYEVIIVDNNSADGTAEMVRKEFSAFHLIVNEKNRGVAPSRNQALRISRGRYVVILDADMILLENSLATMMEFMNNTPDAGMCGCKLISPDGAIQLNARTYPSPLAFMLRRLSFLRIARNSRTLRNHEMSDWDRSDVRKVDYVIGACQFIRREALEQVGLLDERIFYGPEDIDYCIRMYRAGWNVYYVPFTSIIHHEQRITKSQFISKITWYHVKSVVYIFLKYRGKLSRN